MKLPQLQHIWVARSKALNGNRLAPKGELRRFQNIFPIKNIALVGALRSPEDGRLNMRDELICRAIMRETIPHIPLSKDCTVDIYSLEENKDIFSSDKRYDLVIFCNVFYFNQTLANSTSSEKAVRKPDDYTDLVKTLNCRFIATSGFVFYDDYIDGSYFSQPSTYDLSQSPGQRLLKRNDFTLTHTTRCEIKLMQPYIRAAKTCMPDLPNIDFAVRNDELEIIASQDKAAETPLFGGGVEALQKMELMASIQVTRHGRRPIGNSERAEWETLAGLRDKLARPLNWRERAEIHIRQALA